jgi:hypothetical protein
MTSPSEDDSDSDLESGSEVIILGAECNATLNGNDTTPTSSTLNRNEANPASATLDGNDTNPTSATLNGNEANPIPVTHEEVGGAHPNRTSCADNVGGCVSGGSSTGDMDNDSESEVDVFALNPPMELNFT